LFEGVLAACEVLVPEVGLAHEIYVEAKTVYETIKPVSDLMEKAEQGLIANSVEEATNQLQELTKQFAEDVTDNALRVKQAAQNGLGPALDRYVRDNPQEFPAGDDGYYKQLCDQALGLHDPDISEVRMEVWNTVFPPFKEKVLIAAAQIHFFHEMDSDVERLDLRPGHRPSSIGPSADGVLRAPVNTKQRPEPSEKVRPTSADGAGLVQPVLNCADT